MSDLTIQVSRCLQNAPHTMPRPRQAHAKDQKVADFEWNEEDHPRDPDGKFTEGGGGSSGGGGGFTVAPPEKRITYKAGRGGETASYDPRFFKHQPLFLEYEGSQVDMERDELVKIAPYNSDPPGATASPDVIYRGVSAGEWAHIQETGEIKSGGEYNIGPGQVGLTYFGSDPQIAQSYAHGFAPRKYKPSWDRPAYVVAVKRPPPELIREVPGTGDNEIGVVGPVSTDQIIGVYRGDVIAYTPEYNGRGVSVSASATLHWTKIDTPAPRARAQEEGLPSPPITGPLVPDPPTQIGEMTSIPRLPGATWEEEVRAYGKHVAGVLGYPPEKIVVTSAEHKFRVNGVDYVAAGTAHHDTGEVKLYTANIGSNHSSFVGLVAHEVEHQRFFTVMDAYLKEATEVHQLTAPVQDIMHPDGTLKPPYDARFPVYAGWVKTYNGKEMAAQDGVSDYSAAYWEGYKVNQVQIDSAIHETLAEIARFDATGIAPRLTAIKEKPVWVAFYDFVNSTYDRLTSQHVTRSLAKGIRAEKRALRKEWAAHEAQMEAIKAYQLEHPETGDPTTNPTTSMINALLERQRK